MLDAFLSYFIKAKIGTKLLEKWDYTKRGTEVNVGASSSNLCFKMQKKNLENMCTSFH